MKRAQHNAADVARASGSHPNTIRAVINGKADMTWERAEGVLEYLGYAVLIVPKDANRLSSSMDAAPIDETDSDKVPA
jgi:hypothetical protein